MSSNEIKLWEEKKTQDYRHSTSRKGISKKYADTTVHVATAEIINEGFLNREKLENMLNVEIIQI
jgi:RNase H-fold protein (predicted Holliday junction resolvase)